MDPGSSCKLFPIAHNKDSNPNVYNNKWCNKK